MFQGVNVQKNQFQSLGRSHLLTGRNLEALGPGPASENSCRLSLGLSFCRDCGSIARGESWLTWKMEEEGKEGISWLAAELAAEGSCLLRTHQWWPPPSPLAAALTLSRLLRAQGRSYGSIKSGDNAKQR